MKYILYLNCNIPEDEEERERLEEALNLFDYTTEGYDVGEPYGINEEDAEALGIYPTLYGIEQFMRVLLNEFDLSVPFPELFKETYSYFNGEFLYEPVIENGEEE